MRRIIIISVFGLLWITSFSQDWAPIGAKWYYGEGFAFSGDIDYILYTSEKDTTVKGQTCRKISKRHDCYCYDRPNFELMFSKNDSVFYYDNQLDTFQLLYNFNAIKNDSWFFKFKDVPSRRIDTVDINVDSVGSIQANSKTLKQLYVTYTIRFEDTQQQYQSRIIEKVGDISFMFNFYPSMTMACDINYSKGIRCYDDADLGNYHFDSQDYCTYTYVWTDIKNESKKNITLFPNPSNELIRITGLNQTGYYSIFDINGKLIKSDIVADSQISIIDLLKGFYTIIVTDRNGLLILRDKLIKN